MEANKRCIADGGNLAILNSMELNEFALKKFRPLGFWIGATDGEVESVWKWIDGSRVQLKNWQIMEPNGGNRQNCLGFGSGGRWDDVGCHEAATHLCERKRTKNKACVMVP